MATRRCFRWLHKWEYDGGVQRIVTASQYRHCKKCGKKEHMKFYYGELWSVEEVRDD